jgi:GDP-L-fucose synthase
LRRFHEAKLNKSEDVVVWGTGSALREFLHVDDMAAASIHVMNLDSEKYQLQVNPRLSHINVGTGKECSIRQLTESIAEIVGFQGNIVWDTEKPDGALRKLMDSSRIFDLGWQPKHDLQDGLKDAYTWFTTNITSVRH